MPKATRGKRAKIQRLQAIAIRSLRKQWAVQQPRLKKAGRAVAKAWRIAHHHTAHKPHVFLARKFKWYHKWHQHKYHGHAHAAILAVYVGAVFIFSFVTIRNALAADLIDNWNFASAAPYTLDAGIETSGSAARLKAQNYTADADTMALYHLDEPSGTTVTDSSSNSNNGTVGNTASWVTGNLNNALSLNGVFTNVNAADSASLSLSQDNTLEAWTKFNTSFGAGTHTRKQGVVNKGAYQLYYDQETGKVTYELTNNSATTWTQQAGNDVKGSWDLNGKLAVSAQVAIGSDVYAGLGNAVGDAEVWKWNGTVWSQIGGDGKNSSWADQTFESVLSMAANGNTLYAGLGSTAGDAEVWSCDTSTNCTTWTKIGGDGINSGWVVNTYENVDSMTVMAGNLYVGLGTGANDAEVWRWNGSVWTKIGGDSLNSGWTTNFEQVASLTNDGTNVYAGLGASATDAEVWRWNGTAWTKIGGDGLNSSWNTVYETVVSMRYAGSVLYAGLGLTAGEAEVWSWNGTTWTQIGGDTLNSSWDASSYEAVFSFADDGTNLYAGLGSTAGDNEVWRWNGTIWAKIGGDGLNSGFTNTHTVVQSLIYANSTLYAGLQAAGNNAEVWTFNGSTWTRMGGGYVNKSWGFFNLQDVETLTASGDYLYAATGNTVAGNALVFRFDGSEWEVVGGQGVNSSWAVNTYEAVQSMVSAGGNLYAALGTTANDAEVWRFNGSSWTQIGGDSLNSGWTTNYEEAYTLAAIGTDVYVGLGNTANDAEVWRWNGTAWTKIGGDSLNSGWTTNFERVSSMGVYNGLLHVGLGASTTDAEVWRWSGSAWTRIGGDGVNSSWNTNYEQVESLYPYNGKLYAALGTTTADAEVWEWTGTTWTQIGGDGLNSSWLDGQYEQVKTMVVYNGCLYAGLSNTAGDAEVWQLDGSTWTQIGGDAMNNSWAVNAAETVRAFSVYKGKLYAGLGDTANTDAAIWSYGNNGFLQSDTVGQNTSWHHIAATYDGTTMKLFIDGVEDSSTNISLTMPDTSQALVVGSNFGPTESGLSQGYFEGQLDEVRISDIARTSFTTKPYATTPQTLHLTTPVRTSGIWHWDTFAASETANGGTVTYRLSDNGGSTWKYWNGSGWIQSSALAEANPMATVNTNIATFPVTFQGITWQAILSGNGDQRVTLNSVALESTSDTTVPSTAGMTIAALKAAGGSALSSNAWTNGSSPYFSWNAGTDSESGVKGYCAYLGTDNAADPVTTKGLLGTSPVATDGFCQFIVSGANLDLATPGIVGTPLSTSNSPYYFTLKAIDNAGNISTNSTQFQFRFDNTVPNNPAFINAPSGFVNNKAVTLTWSTAGGDSPSDTNSGLVGLQYRIGPSGTWYGDDHTGAGDINDILNNDGTYTMQPTPDFANLLEGVNTVYFRTWDVAGNVTTSYVTAAVKINTAGAPSEPQNLIATPSTNTTNAFAFSWAAPATFVGNASNLTYCYTINTIPSEANCTFTSGGVTSLGSGPYATQPGANTFYVVARDESNSINYASFSSTTFTANTTAPGIPLNVDIVDVSIKSTNNWRLALTWDVPTSVGSGVSSYRILRSTDNVNFSVVGSSSSTTYIDAGLSQIRYYYQIKACDSTNNCGAVSATVDIIPTGKFTTAALLVAEPTVSDITTKRATISWSTDRASDSKVALGTSSGVYSPSEIGNSAQVSAHEIELDNLSAGTTYYFVVKWTDEDGNTGTSQEFTFTTAPPPSFKEISTTSVTLTTATIQFTAKNANKVSLMYGASEGFGGIKTINTSLAESTYSLEITGLTDGTKYFYKLVSYDSESNAYEGSVFSFNTPPRPRITNLRFQAMPGEPTSTQQITWQTNVAATSSLTYGKVGTAGAEVSDSKVVTDHEMIIRDLEDSSEYFLVAQSRDGEGNVATSDRQTFRTALDTRSPKISNIEVESSIRGTGAEARGQVVVSWRTDEAATSQVAFAEGSDATVFNSRTAEDLTLSFEHIVIVSDLPTSKVYSVQPISRDKTANAGTGEPQSAIIGRASDSVLTIVIDILKKVFGF